MYITVPTLNTLLGTDIDANIDFNQDQGVAYGEMDTFSIRWSGILIAPEDGDYDFRAYTDDGVRLYIDGQALILDWVNQAPSNAFGSATLAQGEHSIVVEYYENGGQAVCRLDWAYGGSGYSVIETESFLPYDLDGCLAEDCCETELTWNQELSDYTVECSEDIPATCEEFATGVEAVNECDGSTYEAVCVPFENSDAAPATLCSATTAKRDSDLGDGEYDATDAAVRIYGLAALGGADSDYFVEDPNAPLSFEYAQGNGTARLTGRVYCRENMDQWFDVDAFFTGGQVASEWLAEDPNHAIVDQR